MLENKITRHYVLGSIHKWTAHALTVIVGINYLYDFLGSSQIQSESTQTLRLEETEEYKHGYRMYMLTNASYLVVVAFCIGTTLYYKGVEGKTWDNVSVRCGFFIAKAAMLTMRNHGPLLYFCMLLQWYNIALIMNHRRDSIPGKSFPVQCFLAYFTMQQYYLRSNHRDRIDAIPYGQVCPGGIECSEEFHWVLIIFKMFGPYIIGLQLLPLIVKARIMHVHAHIKNFEVELP